MKYYFEVLRKYAVFNGRSRRKEYWMFFLFSMIICIIIGIVEGIVGLFPERDSSLFANIYSLAILIPSIAVGVRRMHDVDKSGWFLLIPIYNLILACTNGTEGENRYGDDPKSVEGE